MEHIREIINGWAPTIVAVLGLIVAYDKASPRIHRIWARLNLYRRVHKLEQEVEEITHA